MATAFCGLVTTWKATTEITGFFLYNDCLDKDRAADFK